MSKQFTTRVELHNEAAEDTDVYSHLHTEMESKGFSRTITSDEGMTYHMPDAEYYIKTDDTQNAETIRQIALLATIKAIKENTLVKAPVPLTHFSILVTGSNYQAWIGLKPI